MRVSINNGLIISCVFLLTLFTSSCKEENTSYRGNIVKIEGSKGNWKLSVNGKPFKLRGVGVGQAKGQNGKDDYLKMAKEMDANTVRTWGISQGNREYLATAHQYGLYVDAGIWLNQVFENGTCSYLTDEKCKEEAKSQAIDYVKNNMNDPAILFWNIGNETIYWTKDEKERIGFCKFYEELIREVRAIDPFHPVIYSSAYTTDMPYMKKYVPSLDILGINAYGGLENAHREIISSMDIPYIVTEYGPLGPWDRPKDVNGKPYEMTDASKTQYYKQYTKEIESFEGYCLGGFVFFLGDTTQVSFTWWNLNYGEFKKLSYLTMQSIYAGSEIKSHPPLVKNMILSKKRNLKPGQEFEIRVELEEGDQPKFKYYYFASTDKESSLEEYPNTEVSININGEGPVVKARAPEKPGIYRIYAVVMDPDHNTGTLSATISVAEEKAQSFDNKKADGIADTLPEHSQK